MNRMKMLHIFAAVALVLPCWADGIFVEPMEEAWDHSLKLAVNDFQRKMKVGGKRREVRLLLAETAEEAAVFLSGNIHIERVKDRTDTIWVRSAPLLCTVDANIESRDAEGNLLWVYEVKSNDSARDCQSDVFSARAIRRIAEKLAKDYPELFEQVVRLPEP